MCSGLVCRSLCVCGLEFPIASGARSKSGLGNAECSAGRVSEGGSTPCAGLDTVHEGPYAENTGDQPIILATSILHVQPGKSLHDSVNKRTTTCQVRD